MARSLECQTNETMDIQRPAADLARIKRRRVAYWAAGLAALLLVTLGLSRLKPAAPSVERATVWTDTVKRGAMVRQVRGLGTLVPEEIRWIPALTEARVERIIVHPGTRVDRRHRDPGAQQPGGGARGARGRVAGAGRRGANTPSCGSGSKASGSTRRRAAARVQAEYEQARMRQGRRRGSGQARPGRGPQRCGSRRSRPRSSTSATSSSSSAWRSPESPSRPSSPRSRPGRAEPRPRSAAPQPGRGARVCARASTGVLQQVPVEVGQRVTPGTNLARVAQPDQLKAEVRIAETQAKDVQIGQQASIDTRNGVDRRARSRASTRRCRTAPSRSTSRSRASCPRARGRT